jgi:hypothetical protein
MLKVVSVKSVKSFKIMVQTIRMYISLTRQR